MGFISFALFLLELAPSIATLGQQAIDLFTWGADTIKKGQAEGRTEPTDEEWAYVRSERARLTALLEEDPA